MRRLLAALVLAAAPTAMAEDRIQPITREEAGAWSFLSDQVMGGVSEGAAAYAEENGTGFLRLTGDVSTENRGGFLQMRRAIALPAEAEGLVLRVRGNGARYYVHLRTSGLRMPWQFYQASFETSPDWREVRLPFSAFVPRGGFQRPDLRPDTVESLGIAAYGADYAADVAVAGLGVY